MLKKRRKRNNRRIAPVLFLFIVLGICMAMFIRRNAAHGSSTVVYKPMLPQKNLNTAENVPPPPLDLETLPDPFLSYLVRAGRNDAALLKQESEKRKQAEQKLAKLKADAAERLRQMQEPKTELQKLNLHQLLLTAIISSPEGEWAMVRDEKGMGYILKKGTAIGARGGRVAKISGPGKKVIIKEPYLEKEIEIKYKTVFIELAGRGF